MEYRQQIERANLSLECNTAAVPQDDYYYVIHDGKVVGRYRSLKTAQAKYKEILASLDLPPLERDENERRQAQDRAAAHTIVDNMEVATFSKAAASRSKGGKSRTFR